MDPRIVEFRTEFRRGSIPQNYSGILHALIISLLSLIAVVVPLWQMAMPWTWRDWCVLATMSVALNLVEWVSHYLFHRPGRSALRRLLYQRHVNGHHRFFSVDDYTFDNSRDFAIVFLPWFFLPIMTLVWLPMALLAWYWVSPNAGWIVVMSVGISYAWNEVFHICSHMPDSKLLTSIPLLNTARRHHRAHHDPQIMTHWNMNFTVPLWDWLLRSTDLKRGLIGTVFNGNSVKHARPRSEMSSKRTSQ